MLKLWTNDYKGKETALYSLITKYITRELESSLVIQLESKNLKAFPDFLILYNSNSYYIEIKKSLEALKRDLNTRHGKEQVLFLEEIKKTGNKTKIIASFEELEKLIKEIKREVKK